MSSKLREIKNNATHTKQHNFFTEIPYENYLWLIEQAERAEIYKTALMEIGSKCEPPASGRANDALWKADYRRNG